MVFNVKVELTILMRNNIFIIVIIVVNIMTRMIYVYLVLWNICWLNVDFLFGVMNVKVIVVLC